MSDAGRKASGGDCACDEPAPPARSDYLARDYTALRQLMLDGLTQRVPDWTERSAAAETVAIVEALAFAADYLSYYQDATHTEAYLSTARRRISLSRHAALLDYHVSQGTNARAWVQVEVTKQHTLPRGTQLLSAVEGVPPRISSLEAYFRAMQADAVVFETMHDQVLVPDHGAGLAVWAGDGLIIPAGATSLRICTDTPTIKPGDALLVTAPGDPDRGQLDPWARHVIRVKRVEQSADGLPLTRLTWFDEDELPFDIVLPVDGPSNKAGVPGVLSGNLVLADHGRTVPGAPPSIAGEETYADLPNVGAEQAYRPNLPFANVTFAAPIDVDELSRAPATAALKQDPSAALAQVALCEVRGDPLPDVQWTLRRDLFDSGPFATDYVVEMEEGGVGALRFGDGRQGWRPSPGSRFRLRQRVGNGPRGNVGTDFFAHVVTTAQHVVGVRCSMPAQGGTSAESRRAVKVHAPDAYRIQQRCVTLGDYVDMARRFGMCDAAAEYGFTGSWRVVTVHARCGSSWELPAAEQRALREYLAARAMAGTAVEVFGPVPLPVVITLRVHLARSTSRAAVTERLDAAFSAARPKEGSDPGFFSPTRFTFGQALYLSEVIRTANEVEGVHFVEAIEFQRWGQPARGELELGVIAAQPSQIIRVDSDPDRPSHGRVRFALEGGR